METISTKESNPIVVVFKKSKEHFGFLAEEEDLPVVVVEIQFFGQEFLCAITKTTTTTVNKKQ